jgi:hypothetical protein
MPWGVMIGLVMLGAAILLFLIAVPRRGEVVWFLKRDGAQWAYTTTIIILVVWGGALIVSDAN